MPDQNCESCTGAHRIRCTPRQDATARAPKEVRRWNRRGRESLASYSAVGRSGGVGAASTHLLLFVLDGQMQEGQLHGVRRRNVDVASRVLLVVQYHSQLLGASRLVQKVDRELLALSP